MLLLILDAIIEIEHSDSVHDKMADIYAIGFQEIVDLNAQNIMAASSDNAKACKFNFTYFLINPIKKNYFFRG